MEKLVWEVLLGHCRPLPPSSGLPTYRNSCESTIASVLEDLTQRFKYFQAQFCIVKVEV